MANKRKYKEKMNINHSIEVVVVGKLDRLALARMSSRTALINFAIEQYLKKFKA